MFDFIIKIFSKNKQKIKREKTFVCKHCKLTCNNCTSMFCYSCHSNINNPCPKCKINKKDHWDDIQYNCAENHNNRCPILKEYQNNRNKLYSEYRDRKMEELSKK